MLEVKRREGESAGSLLYRFSKKVMRSGVLREAKKRRFYVKSSNRRNRRVSAIYRAAKAEEIKKLRKLGTVK